MNVDNYRRYDIVMFDNYPEKKKIKKKYILTLNKN